MLPWIPGSEISVSALLLQMFTVFHWGRLCLYKIQRPLWLGEMERWGSRVRLVKQSFRNDSMSYCPLTTPLTLKQNVLATGQCYSESLSSFISSPAAQKSYWDGTEWNYQLSNISAINQEWQTHTYTPSHTLKSSETDAYTWKGHRLVFACLNAKSCSPFPSLLHTCSALFAWRWKHPILPA